MHENRKKERKRKQIRDIFCTAKVGKHTKNGAGSSRLDEWYITSFELQTDVKQKLVESPKSECHMVH